MATKRKIGGVDGVDDAGPVPPGAPRTVSVACPHSPAVTGSPPRGKDTGGRSACQPPPTVTLVRTGLSLMWRAVEDYLVFLLASAEHHLDGAPAHAADGATPAGDFGPVAVAPFMAAYATADGLVRHYAKTDQAVLAPLQSMFASVLRRTKCGPARTPLVTQGMQRKSCSRPPAGALPLYASGGVTDGNGEQHRAAVAPSAVPPPSPPPPPDLSCALLQWRRFKFLAEWCRRLFAPRDRALTRRACDDPRSVTACLLEVFVRWSLPPAPLRSPPSSSSFAASNTALDAAAGSGSSANCGPAARLPSLSAAGAVTVVCHGDPPWEDYVLDSLRAAAAAAEAAEDVAAQAAAAPVGASACGDGDIDDGGGGRGGNYIADFIGPVHRVLLECAERHVFTELALCWRRATERCHPPGASVDDSSGWHPGRDGAGGRAVQSPVAAAPSLCSPTGASSAEPALAVTAAATVAAGASLAFLCAQTPIARAQQPARGVGGCACANQQRHRGRRRRCRYACTFAPPLLRHRWHPHASLRPPDDGRGGGAGASAAAAFVAQDHRKQHQHQHQPPRLDLRSPLMAAALWGRLAGRVRAVVARFCHDQLRAVEVGPAAAGAVAAAVAASPADEAARFLRRGQRVRAALAAAFRPTLPPDTYAAAVVDSFCNAFVCGPRFAALLAGGGGPGGTDAGVAAWFRVPAAAQGPLSPQRDRVTEVFRFIAICGGGTPAVRRQQHRIHAECASLYHAGVCASVRRLVDELCRKQLQHEDAAGHQQRWRRQQQQPWESSAHRAGTLQRLAALWALHLQVQSEWFEDRLVYWTSLKHGFHQVLCVDPPAAYVQLFGGFEAHAASFCHHWVVKAGEPAAPSTAVGRAAADAVAARAADAGDDKLGDGERQEGGGNDGDGGRDSGGSGGWWPLGATMAFVTQLCDQGKLEALLRGGLEARWQQQLHQRQQQSRGAQWRSPATAVLLEREEALLALLASTQSAFRVRRHREALGRIVAANSRGATVPATQPAT